MTNLTSHWQTLFPLLPHINSGSPSTYVEQQPVDVVMISRTYDRSFVPFTLDTQEVYDIHFCNPEEIGHVSPRSHVEVLSFIARENAGAFTIGVLSFLESDSSFTVVER